MIDVIGLYWTPLAVFGGGLLLGQHRPWSSHGVAWISAAMFCVLLAQLLAVVFSLLRHPAQPWANIASGFAYWLTCAAAVAASMFISGSWT